MQRGKFGRLFVVLFTCVLKDKKSPHPSFLDRSKAECKHPSQDDRDRLGASSRAAIGIVPASHTGHPFKKQMSFWNQHCLPAWLCELASSSGTEMGPEPLLTWFC